MYECMTQRGIQTRLRYAFALGRVRSTFHVSSPNKVLRGAIWRDLFDRQLMSNLALVPQGCMLALVSGSAILV